MKLEDISVLAAENRLAVMGAFPLAREDGIEGCLTMVMLGPAEPGFWPHVTASPEWQDGAPDPVDRWSRRVIGTMASYLGGEARFPFGGPPHFPFHTWAKFTNEIWESPVKLLVHARAGLLLSFRGAVAVREVLDLPYSSPPRPCDTCEDKPCLTACPVAALSPAGYDLAACHGFLDTGPECMTMGCAARRACPVSHCYARMQEQSAYHMRQFHT